MRVSSVSSKFLATIGLYVYTARLRKEKQMDTNGILDELRSERDRLTGAIEALESGDGSERGGAEERLEDEQSQNFVVSTGSLPLAGVVCPK